MKLTKKLSAILLAVVMVFGVMSFGAFAENEAARYITGTVNVSVCTPVEGEAPLTDSVSESGKVIVSEFVWLDANGKEVTSAFEKSVSYTALITVTPIQGYLFDEDFEITVEGESVTVVSSSESSLTVKAVFDCENNGNSDNSGSSDGGFSLASVWSVILGVLKIIRDLIAHFIGY